MRTTIPLIITYAFHKGMHETVSIIDENLASNNYSFPIQAIHALGLDQPISRI